MSDHSFPAPVRLRCEYRADPLGIDVPKPGLSWIIPPSPECRGQVQTAYQILVASSDQNLAEDEGDMWDSGKVETDRSANVPYEGIALASGRKCFWKVRCWNGGDVVGAYSAPAVFEMGLLDPSEWQGKWISADGGISSPLLRMAIHIDRPVARGRVYICGLGYYELIINGKKVGDNLLDPATTYYHNDQPFKLHSRVLYVTHDVTELIRRGENAVGVMLGNGWYSAEPDVPPSPSHRQPYGDVPVLLAQVNLEFNNGDRASFFTDENWKWSGGPILYNDYSNGEVYDARLEQPGWDGPGFEDSHWRQAKAVEGPDGELKAQTVPPIKVMDTIKPVRIVHVDADRCIFDFGRHFSGWTRIRVSGPMGTKITLKHGAEVTKDGYLDARSNLYNLYCTHIARQTDSYILGGEGEEAWEPRFTLHGFRYVELIGLPGTPTLETVRGRHVRSSVEVAGNFECSNELVQKIHDIVCRTFSSSMQGFPQDAADRSERVGWLGDPIPEDFMYNFDTAAFWSKWAMDLRDSQKPNGDLPVICPLHWRTTGDFYSNMPVWKSTYPIIVWYVYLFYDDESILAEHYRGMERLADYFASMATDHIITAGLGDHMEPQADGTSSSSPKRTPSALTSTAYYYYDVLVLSWSAEILKKRNAAQKYRELADEIRNAFNTRFLDRETGNYATGSQSSNAMALLFDLVPEDVEKAVVQNLITDIETARDGHLFTGMLGTNALVQVLPRHGAAELMYRIATQKTFPGWGYMVESGATALWESWDGDPETQLSRNMKLFGSIGKFFYREIAGITSAAPGFRRILIRPRAFGDLDFARASLETVRGHVSVEWRLLDGGLSLNVTIPVNATAEVWLPKRGQGGATVTEGGETVWAGGELTIHGGVLTTQGGNQTGKPTGISKGTEDVENVVLEVGSGTYDFRVVSS